MNECSKKTRSRSPRRRRSRRHPTCASFTHPVHARSSDGEDLACGSAAGPLAAHLVRHGFLASGTEITLSQGEVIGRPSTLYAIARTDRDDIRSIRVGGGVCLMGAEEHRNENRR
ncbi:PhzF family phenazine biosynthesis protein (plasmid) [Streptomycetaceae bacterium NBC_01309]